MIASLYPISFVLALAALLGWFFFQHSNKLSSLLRMVFFGAMLTYLFAMFNVEATVAYKLSTLFRDLIIISGISAGFSLMFKNTKLFLIMAAAVGLIYHFYFKAVLVQTFPQPSAITKSVSDIPLDSEWELLVEVKEQHSINEISELLHKYDLNFESAFKMNDRAITELDDYLVINIPANRISDLSKIKEAIRQSKSIDWVEENEQINIEPMESVAEPLRSNRKYGINDPQIQQLWGFEQMKVDDLYTYVKKEKIKPKKKARIFILDTGVDASHEDLSANYRSLKTKYDKDVKGHGTHCAGIAAAVSNNGLGIASFSPNNEFVEVTSIKVLADFGGGTQRGIINGILEAADQGADVISMSLGGPSNSSRQKAYSDAVKYANDKGAIVVVAAGNSNADAKNYAPASATGVITVAAVDTTLARASFSNSVKNIKMGIAAPGVKIYSTIPDNKYAFFNGTSMATPYVAGVVGVMKSIRPELTTKEVYKILNDTGIKTEATKETGKFIQVDAIIKNL